MNKRHWYIIKLLKHILSHDPTPITFDNIVVMLNKSLEFLRNKRSVSDFEGMEITELIPILREFSERKMYNYIRFGGNGNVDYIQKVCDKSCIPHHEILPSTAKFYEFYRVTVDFDKQIVDAIPDHYVINPRILMYDTICVTVK